MIFQLEAASRPLPQVVFHESKIKMPFLSISIVCSHPSFHWFLFCMCQKVRTSHLTLPQPHIRPYSTRTARTLTFDPTLPKKRNPSKKKQHCPVHIRPYPTFPGSHSTLPHMRSNSSRFTFDPASNQPSVNQPPLNNYIHWYQINRSRFSWVTKTFYWVTKTFY